MRWWWGEGRAHINTQQNQEFNPCALLLLKKNPYALLTPPFSPRSLLHRRRWDRLTANGEKRNREIILPLLTPFPGIAATLLFLLSVVLHCVCRNSAVSSSFWSENPVDEHGERALENCGDNSTRFKKKILEWTPQRSNDEHTHPWIVIHELLARGYWCMQGIKLWLLVDSTFS